MACFCPLFLLPHDLITSMILQNVGLADLVNLDSACCSRNTREEWRAVCREAIPVDLAPVWQPSTAFIALRWLKTKGIRARNVLADDSRQFFNLIIAEPDNAESVRLCGEPSFLDEEIEGAVHFANKVISWSGFTAGNTKLSTGYFKNLEELLMPPYKRSNAAWVAEAVANNHKVTSLEITFKVSPGDEFFAALSTRRATITKLMMTFKAAARGQSLLNRFAQCCPRVRELYFTIAGNRGPWGAIRLQEDQVEGIVKHCLDLTELYIGNAEVPAGSLRRLLLNCPKLQALHIPNTTVTHRELLALSARCLPDVIDPNPLRHLTVSWAVEDTTTLFTAAGMLRDLRTLKLTSGETAEWENFPVALKYMSELRTLFFQSTADFAMQCEILSAIAKHCPQLRSLEVECFANFYCGDGFTEVLSQCNCLEHFKLSLDRDLYDLDWSVVVSVEDDVFFGITTRAEARWLKTIRFNGAFLSDKGMAAVARHFPLLTTVDIVDATALTDASLLALSQHCPHLRDVRIQDTKEAFTAVAVEALCQVCPRLRSVSVNNNYSSDGAMEGLKQRLIGQGRNIVFA